MLQVRESFNRFKLGNLFHLVQSLALPVLVLFLIRSELTAVAILLVLISKWRIFAVQPRHWFANIRANTTDIVVGLSVVTFIYLIGRGAAGFSSFSAPLQVAWTIFYAVWLVGIKPRSSELLVAAQAFISNILGLTALLWLAESSNLPETVVVVAAWAIALTGARHFLSSYEEPLIRVLSFGWGLIVAELVWLLNRWTIVYTLFDVLPVPLLTIVVGVLSYYTATLYHLEKKERLGRKKAARLILFACAILLMLIVLTDWSANI